MFTFKEPQNNGPILTIEQGHFTYSLNTISKFCTNRKTLIKHFSMSTECLHLQSDWENAMTFTIKPTNLLV